MQQREIASPGRRERAKALRRERLKTAALEVFSEKGYQAATTREIALRAGIGVGTLFRYAEQKRDLLLMIVNDGLDAATQEAIENIDDDSSLVDQLVELFAPRFRYWGARLDLARESMHETVLARSSGDASQEARRYLQGRAALVDLLVDIVRRQQAKGTIDRGEEPSVIAALFLAIYLSQLRLWLAERRPTVKKGVAYLRRLLGLAIDGVGART
ncbi:MAG TPA: helix-turn-helix domain-containing protein [Candidatus Acidoferrum sp.]|nr:helix-turn-helix domain-containing protein [Candidatus Acidoferrum sp.]